MLTAYLDQNAPKSTQLRLTAGRLLRAVEDGRLSEWSLVLLYSSPAELAGDVPVGQPLLRTSLSLWTPFRESGAWTKHCG